MRLRIDICIATSITFSIITLVSFWTFSSLFAETSIFYIGLPFTLSVFFFSLTILRRDFQQRIFEIARSQIIDVFIYILTISSIIIVLSVPAYEGSMLEWVNIPPLNWLRYLSALLLTSFLPGYFLLKILDRKHVITGSIVIVLSYLLSLFTTFLAGFFILLSASSIKVLGLQIIITANIAFLVTRHFTNREKPRNYLLNVNWTELGLILSALAVITVGSLLVMSNNMPLTSGDMVRHYGTALDLSKGFSMYGGQLVTYPGGYLFSVYLGVIFALAGIPAAIAVQGLYILSFMSLLAFYSTIKVWLSNLDKRLPLVATVLSILLGFGGLYALHLKFADPTYVSIVQLLSTTTSKTYDIYMRVLYLPDIVAPLWNIGLPVFFTLLYFLKKESCLLTKAAIVSLLVTLGYLAHASEIFFFLFILFIYVLCIRRRNEAKIGPYVVLGLGVVALLDFIAPTQVYVLSGAGTALSLPFVAALILATLTSVAELVKDRYAFRFSPNLRHSFLKKLRKSWTYGRWVLLYVYVFFLVVWLTIVNDFNLWAWGGFDFTPFFVLPLRLGAVGLLAVIAIFVYFKKIIQNKSLFFFLLMIPIGFLLEQGANYYLLYYPAYRYGTLTFIGACVIAAYGFTTLIDKARQSTKRKIIASVLLGFLIVSGMLSTTLFYVNASNYSLNRQIAQEELDALDYIRQNTPTNASVLTFTTESADSLRNYAGLNAVQDAQRWAQLLSTSNPYIITHILSSSNIKYIYVTQRDIQFLNAYSLDSFVKYFSKVLANDRATIYEVPISNAPSPEASIGVLHFPPPTQDIDDTEWLDDSFTEGWHPDRQYGEVKNYASNVNNGIMEISVTSNQSGNIWASYTLSEISLNTTTHPFLSFRYRVVNNLTWFTFQLWNSTNKICLYVEHLSAADFTTMALALPENQIITKIEIITETVKDAPAGTTAHAYIDYIKFSVPTSIWKDDAFLSDWELYKTYGNLSDYNAHSDGATLEINVTSNQSGTVWASYSLPLKLKSKDSILSFRYKVDNDHTWFTIILQNASHRFFFYRGHLTETFTTKSYPLPDGQTITRIEIIVETTDKAPPQTTAVAQIDSIEISQQPFSEKNVLPALFVSLLHSNYKTLYVDDLLIENIDKYLSNYTHIILPSDPQFPVESLLKWVSDGHTLTVFNTYGNGFFANLFGVNNSSPTLSTNNINSGKVLYINAFPKIAFGEEDDILQPDFLKEVKTHLNLEESIQKVDVLPVYNSIFGGIQIQGDLEVTTDILMLQGAIYLPNSPFSVDESTEIKIYGNITLTIKNATLTIFPSESYMLIKPDNYPIEGEAFVNASESALIIADGNVINNSNTSIFFRFTSTGTSLYARLPSISASGTIIFDQLDVHAALYVPLAGIIQQSAKIEGEAQFSTLYVTNLLTIFSSFRASGNILNLGETTTVRPNIPWVEVLTSPYNLAFNLLYVLGIACYALLNSPDHIRKEIV